MGHRTTRPHATLRACRIGRYALALAVLAWLAGAPVLAQTGPAQVDRVIDGDTIRVRLDGARYTVRLTGVDTPETTHPTRGVEPDGPDAAAYTTARLTGATGQGVPKDPREAVIWYHQSADLGYAAGQYNLARAYYFGDGAPLDRSQAATWCRRAADQGHANAQFSLALMLDAGRGTTRDRAAADRWYRLAAAQGHQQAQRMIDAPTVRPLPGPFDPHEPSTDDAVLIQRASERAAAAYCAAHQAARHADTTLDRAAQILGRIVAAANVLDRHEQNRSAAYSRLCQTITNLDRTAERTNHRLQAIIKALKQRDKETIAIEARLRQTMIDRIGDPQGVPADDEPATGTLTLTNDQESRPDAE